MPSTTISIITPTLNSAALLPLAIASVDLAGCEHLIVDGGSSDGTIGIARAMPRLRLLPGPDRGIYDAFNKGVRAATGEVVGFLNSDDLYPPGALDSVLRCFDDNPGLDLVCGNAEVVACEQGRWEVVSTHSLAAERALHPAAVMRRVPLINARFFRRELFERVGYFSLDYPLAADRELLVRCATHGVSARYLPRTVYQYRAHAGSRTLAGTPAVARRLAAENLRMAEAFLREKPGDPALQRTALDWHLDYITTDLKAALELHAWRDIPAILRRAWVQDPRWWQRLLPVVLRKLRGRMAAGH